MNKYFSIAIITLISVFGLSFMSQEYRVDENCFIIHESNPKTGKLKFYRKNANSQVYGSLNNLKESLKSDGKELIFAMNGGMYNKDRSPQGLFVENGIVTQKLEVRKGGFGNFYLQPNGIFYLTQDGKARVVKTTEFKLDSTIKYATQSGPMLLINGSYHEKLMKGSLNLHIRNGVGILPNGNVLFAMSKEKVNFYDLATLFKQRGCSYALYLDGFVSRTYLPESNWIQLDGNFGTIIGEIK